MRINLRPLARSVLAGILACLATAALIMVSPSAAQAACDWNIKDRWVFYQDNGITVEFYIHSQRDGGQIQGDAHYTNKEGAGSGVDGTFDGTIEGSHFSFTVSWGGVYEGQIGEHGEMSGTTSGIGWHERDGKRARCVADTPLLPPASAVKITFCQDYAGTAATVIGQAQQLACGFDGPRWSLKEDHRNWCVGLADNNYRTLAAVENDARAAGLLDCRKKNAAAAAAGLKNRPPIGSKPILNGTPAAPAAPAGIDRRLHRFETSPSK